MIVNVITLSFKFYKNFLVWHFTKEKCCPSRGCIIGDKVVLCSWTMEYPSYWCLFFLWILFFFWISYFGAWCNVRLLFSWSKITLIPCSQHFNHEEIYERLMIVQTAQIWNILWTSWNIQSTLVSADWKRDVASFKSMHRKDTRISHKLHNVTWNQKLVTDQRLWGCLKEGKQLGGYIRQLSFQQ